MLIRLHVAVAESSLYSYSPFFDLFDPPPPLQFHLSTLVLCLYLLIRYTSDLDKT